MNREAEEDLAGSQGGNQNAHAPEDNIFDKLAEMGNSTISSAGNLEISQLSKCMATMTESMKCLQREVITLKRRSSHNPDYPQRSVKKLRSDEDVSSSEDDQIDRYLAQESTSDGEENEWDEIAGALGRRGISGKSQDIIINSWRQGTKLQYNTYIKKWLHYCEGKANPFSAPVNVVLSFLTQLFTQGLSNSTLNTARSAISSFLRLTGNVNIHNDEVITRFMKGVFNEKPSLPRYKNTWDVKIVLQYLGTLVTAPLLSLSCKLCMLFLLVTAQRCQTLHAIKLSDIHYHSEGIALNISQLIKQSRPGFQTEPIIIKAYKSDTKIYLVKTLQEYIERTKYLRKDNHLLISTTKPHAKVSNQTVTRWIKILLHKAGISTRFKAHSTRSAVTSFAYEKGVPLTEIIKTAGWSNEKTFAKYYNKQIISNTKSLQSVIFANR